MQIEQLNNIERVPLAIDYRRMYRADVVITIGTSTTSTCRVEFVLELSPFGMQQVSVSFLGSTDYPVVPAIKLLKDHILEIDRAGKLP